MALRDRSLCLAGGGGGQDVRSRSPCSMSSRRKTAKHKASIRFGSVPQTTEESPAVTSRARDSVLAHISTLRVFMSTPFPLKSAIKGEDEIPQVISVVETPC